MAGVSIRSRSIRIRRPRLGAFAAQAGAAAVFLVMLAVGVLLLWRRLDGDASVSLPMGMLLATALFAGVLVIGGRLLGQDMGGDISRSRWRDLAPFVDWGGTAALVLLAVGCSYPGNRFIDWLAWVPVIGLDIGIRHGRRGQWTAHEGENVRKSRAAPPEPVAPMREFEGHATTEAPMPPLASAFDGGEWLDGSLLQEVRRIRGEDGVETASATLRAEFVPGQRHAVLHVAFCPPLSFLPEVDVEAGEGPEAEVRVVQAFAHGARLEVRLAEPADEPCSVLVELSATPNS